MTGTFSKNPDALPQLIGEFKPLDEWQAHVSRLFYGLYAGREREFYQTFASADYRLAHALAADYFEQVRRRQKDTRPSGAGTLVVHEWGCGNGNLAACFLSHLKSLDREGAVYPRLRYVLVDDQQAVLESAHKHPDLAGHLDRVDTLLARAEDLATVADGTVDRIICNELWNELPSKLMLRKDGEIEEEYLRPNLSEAKHDERYDGDHGDSSVGGAMYPPASRGAAGRGVVHSYGQLRALAREAANSPNMLKTLYYCHAQKLSTA